MAMVMSHLVFDIFDLGSTFMVLNLIILLKGFFKNKYMLCLKTPSESKSAYLLLLFVVCNTSIPLGQIPFIWYTPDKKLNSWSVL